MAKIKLFDLEKEKPNGKKLYIIENGFFLENTFDTCRKIIKKLDPIITNWNYSFCGMVSHNKYDILILMTDKISNSEYLERICYFKNLFWQRFGWAKKYIFHFFKESAKDKKNDN